MPDQSPRPSPEEIPKSPGARWQVPYFSFWTGQAVSLLGSRVVAFAVIWWLTRSSGSATVLAMATLVGLVPEIVLGPFAGVLVDRWNRRIVMIAADAGVALASLFLAYLYWIDATEIWHIYLILFIRSLIGSFQWPAFLASTALMVPDDQLTRVNGLNQGVGGLINIIGPPLGALLMGVMPLAGVMLVDTFTAVLAILPLLFIFVPQPPRVEIEDERPSYWADLREGFDYIINWRGLLALIGLAVVIKIALTPAFSLLPLLIFDYFDGTAAQFSLAEAALGIGIVVGGIILAVWGGFQRRIFTSLFGIILLGFGLLALGLVPDTLFIAAVLLVFFLGLTTPIIDGPIMAILQGSVTPDMQGRVFTLITSLVSITTPIGLVIAGPVSDQVGLQFWFLLSGAVCILVGLLFFFVPAVVNIDENQGSDTVHAGAMKAAE
ncbi:MAG: MFS transporter [Anaerolineae bacterium]|nr:MAG: MFS transporter [Anaerolineae bacterium]